MFPLNIRWNTIITQERRQNFVWFFVYSEILYKIYKYCIVAKFIVLFRVKIKYKVYVYIVLN